MKCQQANCMKNKYHDSVRGLCHQHHLEYQAALYENYRTQFLVNAKLSDGSNFTARFVDVGDALQTISRLRRIGAKPELEIQKEG